MKSERYYIVCLTDKITIAEIAAIIGKAILLQKQIKKTAKRDRWQHNPIRFLF